MLKKKNAYIHSSHVALIRFPDLLHHLFLSSRARLDGALHCDGPLWVVQGQVLETGQNGERCGLEHLSTNALQTHATLLNGTFMNWFQRLKKNSAEVPSVNSNRLTVKLWSWSPYPARFSSGCVLPSQLIFLQSCCAQVSSVGSPQCCTRQMRLYFYITFS